MISYEDALDRIFRNTKPLGCESILISDDCSGCLYEDLYAPFDMPRFDNSAMDGYAVKSRDTRKASRDKPVVLRLSKDVKTGVKFGLKLKSGEAFSISTGAKIPEGADAVVKKEDVEVRDKSLFIFEPVNRGENIRFKGEDFKIKTKIINKGRYLTPQVKGLLAATGYKRVKIFKRPVISFVSSGSEIVEPGKKLNDYQIYNSNYYSIAALLGKIGVSIKRHLIVKDDIVSILKAFKTSLEDSDILLVSGGVSVGDVDYVKDVLKKLDVDEIFWRIKIKPGKPVYFGTKDRKLIFGLPGNMVSSFTAAILFVLPAIKKMMGFTEYENPEIEADLLNDFVKRGQRKEFLRGRYELRDGKYFVRVLPKQGSHMISTLAESNCLVITDYEEKIYRAGEKVRVYLI